MKRVLISFLSVLLAFILIGLGYFAGRHGPTPLNNGTGSTPDKKILYWYDTMAPRQHFDKPGLSPMGMTMVPKYVDDTEKTDVVRIDSATVQNLGIRTTLVQNRVLASAIQAPGTITWDLRLATIISARVDGVIRTLNVRAPFTAVKKGEPLATLLAPQWSSALGEYGALEHAQSADARALRSAARARLQVLGLTGVDAGQTGQGGGIVLHAPQSGIVATLDVREGQRVSAGQTLMTLNGLSTVWVNAALPQAVAGTVKPGTHVVVRVDAQPGRMFPGVVEALLPEVDTATRTQQARISLDNGDYALSPGMFAQVQLNPVSGPSRLVVPSDALIATGHQTRLILAETGGHFRVVAVQPGRSADGFTEILSGLSSGQRVVLSGQFLIDSEASLSGALERLNEASTSAPATSAPMPGMSMRGDP
jgi:Cu(I)/Ag(I) efflux system membrane fusion protein